MFLSKLFRLLSTAMLGLALVTLPALSGNSVASAHDKSNRSRYSDDDDDRYDHQRRERDRLRRHQRIEDARLRRHQIEERFRYGDSWRDRKSTRLNSSHLGISYAVFCLKKNRYVLTIRVLCCHTLPISFPYTTLFRSASAHDKSNRSRYSDDDDDRYDHQRRERDRLRRHQRIEDARLRRHQIEERFRYGDSW